MADIVSEVQRLLPCPACGALGEWQAVALREDALSSMRNVQLVELSCGACAATRTLTLDALYDEVDRLAHQDREPAPQPSPVPERDQVAGEVLGYRQWLVDDELRLASAHAPDTWQPGTNTATCRQRELGGRWPRHHAPGADCECGLYALHAPTFWYGQDKAASSVLPLALAFGTGQRSYVAGLVVAWGRLEVHHQGFRAEHARVAAIAVPSGDSRKRDAVLARAVAAEYGVPTVPQDELERVAGEFGSPVPAEHHPERVDPYADMAAALRRMYAAPSSGLVIGPNTARTMLGLGSPPPAAPLIQTASSAPAQPATPTPEELRRQAMVDAAARRRPRYDPRAFIPKRKGGQR